MDIYAYLKMDHKKVAKLFSLFETALTEKNKLEIFEMLNKELMLHAESEKNTFYKILEKKWKTEKIVFHGEEEHEEIKNKLKEILSFKKFTPEMESKILELKTIVEHHVATEENEIFKKAKKVLSDEDAMIIKEKMHDYKAKILFATKILETEIA